ncbi:hypothetical protein GSI_02010 [Ganoderma sinense ZZ0214-1]|uniref:Uncharacterized protein n=1 Tax=Ganoderma sinense ZZ0214-1 TaxID=1077348 RepID=A0A2G8SNE4_9APHY|nr:hypothetical protein GSI_02010 [Ganoderma sinense ZZ0214-1]
MQPYLSVNRVRNMVVTGDHSRSFYNPIPPYTVALKLVQTPLELEGAARNAFDGSLALSHPSHIVPSSGSSEKELIVNRTSARGQASILGTSSFDQLVPSASPPLSVTAFELQAYQHPGRILHHYVLFSST